MSEAERSRYRRELKTWSKNELIREVERLRAITREAADRPGDDTREAAGAIIDVAGDPYAASGAVIDARNAILLDEIDVAAVDPDPGHPADPESVFLALVLGGRVNMRDERSRVLFLMPIDGAAGICSQLVGVAGRLGPDFLTLLAERLDVLPRRPET